MPIIYALVSRGTTILAEHFTTTGNFTTVTRLILEKIDPARNDKRSYVYNQHVFHYVIEDGLVFLCMADQDLQRRVAFAFLLNIKNRWRNVFQNRGQNAMAYGMNEAFSQTLAKQMDYYSNDPNADSMNRVKGEIDEVKGIMTRNIEGLLERGEKIDLLVDKTDNLSHHAFKFQKKATKVKNKMWWQNMKMRIVLCIVFLVLILFIVFAACGITFSKCRSSSSDSGGSTTTTTTAAPQLSLDVAGGVANGALVA